MAKKNIRRERFETVAARRVQKIIDFLDSLSNCANTANYEYSQEDVKKMFKVIREQLSTTEAAFDKQLSKSGKNNFKF
ncbi:MAG: hypothetical protein K0S32_1539 [Bacteroidetes bacterium]|jgi:glutaredoxin 2|nr:hypothetical protein [Bacteroidota bacterium]